MCHCLSSSLKKEAWFGFREVYGELDVKDCSGCCAVTSVNPRFSTSAGVNPALCPVWWLQLIFRVFLQCQGVLVEWVMVIEGSIAVLGF